ncbi:dTDP-glucose 4,6-dehydratase [Corynebacterium hansenii]|uniref:dTDP-glucose 4,6-dehydratase n=1 Tax=Corynebacterium hansenii TaxID=394964 RepID=A0ABV7ZN85_9CORY|nr:dTDP-glucose 4,6-dehydratase [Corynebacterium hansenii]WJY98946.1 dTDP-glucose 4,6-dehydratase [Corynebacterium hansenii]
MRILVTGGAGFIGSNFVHRTLETRPDVDVTVLDSFTYAANRDSLREAPADGSSAASDAPFVCEVVSGDVRDAELMDRLVAKHDAVVHFAAESHNDNSLRDADPFVTTNVMGTVNVAKACAKHDVRLHHISTDEVFGDLALDDPARFTTDTPYNPSSPYSASKASADHFVRAWVRSFGLAATISNCSNNYGPRQHPEKLIPRQICGLLRGRSPRVYGTGDNVRDWIHVDDHNDAVWTILDRGTIGETYLIGADGERSNIDVVGDILEAFGRDRGDFVHVTDRPGHDRRYAIDPSSMTALGWEPAHRDFVAGLAETIEWYRDNEEWWSDAYEAAEEGYARVEKRIDL